MKILHLSTGGTISGCESDYSAIEKLSRFFTDAIDIGKYLSESLKMDSSFETKKICYKDSRDITNEDRDVLCKEIIKAYTEKNIKNFLITHGTYTMPETGIFLLDSIPPEILKNISVIITGAMYPMNLVGGDGLLNLGASVSSLINSNIPLEVKINMHARNWDPREIKKDAENLIFEKI